MKNYPAQNPVERKLTPQLEAVAEAYQPASAARKLLSAFLSRLKDKIDTRDIEEWRLIKSIVERLVEEEMEMQKKRNGHRIKHEIFMLELHIAELEEIFTNILREPAFRKRETEPAPEETPSPKKIIDESREAMNENETPVSTRRWREPTPQELEALEMELGNLPSDEELMADLEKEFGI